MIQGHGITFEKIVRIYNGKEIYKNYPKKKEMHSYKMISVPMQAKEQILIFKMLWEKNMNKF